jgi:hypothetical protein
LNKNIIEIKCILRKSGNKSDYLRSKRKFERRKKIVYDEYEEICSQDSAKYWFCNKHATGKTPACDIVSLRMIATKYVDSILYLQICSQDSAKSWFCNKHTTGKTPACDIVSLRMIATKCVDSILNM